MKELESGVATNVYGFYSISVEPGEYTFIISYVGYATVTKTMNVTEDVSLELELKPADVKLEAVVVEGERQNQNVTSVEMSVEKLDVKTIKKMPAFFW